MVQFGTDMLFPSKHVNSKLVQAEVALGATRQGTNTKTPGI